MSFNSLMFDVSYARDSSDLIPAAEISTSINPVYQPSEPCILRTNVSGCSLYGECLISGTNASDVSISERILFTKADGQVSENLFKTIVGVTTANFVGGTIQIQGVLRSGENLNTRRTLGTVRGRIYNARLQAGIQVMGDIQNQSLKFMCRKEDSYIKKGDYLTLDNISYLVEASLHPIYAGQSIHHYETIISRIES